MNHDKLPELDELQRIVAAGGAQLQARVVCEVRSGKHSFPVHVITLGNPSRDVPAVGFFGGVHGLERIGSEVVIAYLASLVMRLKWDSVLQWQLENLRFVFMPLVNPGGMSLGTRANPRGVDLMRNAPISALEDVPFLIGGQRISPRLPWYRGTSHGAMEPENEAVCQVVDEELLSRRFSIALDCHSGFGISDRIWFPYAYTTRPIGHLAEIHALKDIFDRTHAYHRYIFEPQCRMYLAHGDLWDYLYLRACKEPERTMIPLTLEMGSWLWVRKNPRQLFTRYGIFNPTIEHRQHRVLRRHLPWLDFVARAACSHARWVPTDEARRAHRALALQSWYSGTVQ
ncbi:MAG TPA: M14 family zinc carboxypeptidase [Burkholderiaceae bacterium]|nr:M14 family zinc carboxypeptidase [Burkholderiaceae bacterium]